MKTHKYGIEHVHTGKDPQLDIVFVHGLFGHRTKTWTAASGIIPIKNLAVGDNVGEEDDAILSIASSSALDGSHGKIWRFWHKIKSSRSRSPASGHSVQSGSESPAGRITKSVFWPGTYLKEAIPHSRIFTWGYDVDINHVWGSASKATLYQHADQFLSDLSDIRSSQKERDRPILFVAHSLGGLLVKDALNQSCNHPQRHLKAISEATRGIIFMATPHRGAGTATLAKIANDVTLLAFKSPNTSILSDLEINSTTLERISKDFGRYLVTHTWNIRSYREELPTAGVMIVQPDSSVIGWVHEETGLIYGNHTEVTKFGTPDDSGYKSILSTIQRWTESWTVSVRAENPSPTNNSLRARAWDEIHHPENSQWETIEEAFEAGKSQLDGWEHWKSGTYWRQYPSDSNEATLRIDFAWDKNYPATFAILAPKSLWYPGDYHGSFQFFGNYPFTGPEVLFKSVIFSPYVISGHIKGGLLEDGWSPTVTFREILESLATLIVYGPYKVHGEYKEGDLIHYPTLPSSAKYYFDIGGEDKLRRATNFFARTLNQTESPARSLPAHHLVLPHQLEESIIDITELREFVLKRPRGNNLEPENLRTSKISDHFPSTLDYPAWRAAEKLWADALWNRLNIY